MVAESRQARETEPLVRVEGLSKQYAQRRWFSRTEFVVRALDDVSLQIRTGSTLALIGESGSGKSTLARCVARLEEPSSGEIWFEGRNLMALSPRELVPLRRKIQLILQDPAGLNPRLSAIEIISEPLTVQGLGNSPERRRRAVELMEQVGLLPQWSSKRPLELSGGQRQRLAIARALALQPQFLILDEALAGLDLSIQAQILNLLLRLQRLYSLTYLYISHDISVVGNIADNVAVMFSGKIVEQAEASELFAEPQEPYTRSLLTSVPRI